MTRHCETCKFWGTDPEKAANRDFRRCTAVIHDQRGMVDAWRDEMLSEDWHDKDDEEIPAIRDFRAAHRAVVQDGSWYRAALIPRRDFGCVLHEEGDPS